MTPWHCSICIPLNNTFIWRSARLSMMKCCAGQAAGMYVIFLSGQCLYFTIPRCEQQYRLHRLLAFDPTNECRGIFSDWFRFPSFCICKCYNSVRQFKEVKDVMNNRFFHFYTVFKVFEESQVSQTGKEPIQEVGTGCW